MSENNRENVEEDSDSISDGNNDVDADWDRNSSLY